MKNLLQALTVFALAFSTAPLFGASKEAQMSIEEIEQMASFPKQTALKMAALFKTTTNAETQAAILYALGELRSPVSVDLLVENLSLGPSYVTRRPRFGIYPAVDALVKIGTPCTPAILKVMATETNYVRYARSIHVLVRIFGKSAAKFIVEDHISKQAAANSVSRLKEALAIIESFPN